MLGFEKHFLDYCDRKQ